MSALDDDVARTADWLKDTTPRDKAAPVAMWACVEIFGHRKHYGKISEVEKFGAKMLRVDVPAKADTEGEQFETFVYGGGAIFSVTPMTEEAARKWADSYGRFPLWSYSRLPAPSDYELDDDGDGEQ